MGMRRPAEVFPPGEFLREELEERGWTQLDLAEVMGRPAVLVNGIISGKRGITPETAKGLAAALGTSPELWLRLDAAYQLWRGRTGHEIGLVERRAGLYRRAPIREMQKRGWIEPSANPEVLERRLLSFLGIRSLDQRLDLAHAAKKSNAYAEPLSSSQEAWLARARQLAPATSVSSYSAAKLKEAVGRLKELLYAEQEVQHVSGILVDAGVRLLIVQQLPGSKIDGATFWFDKSPVIVLSLRYDRIDNFWFVLMHEIAHVLKGDAVSIDLELLERSEDDLPEPEKQANAFASEQLIPGTELEDFIRRSRPSFSSERVREFAAKLRVHPALVVGQLQHRGEIPWTNFRRMMVPIKEFLVPNAHADGWGVSLPANV